MKITSLIGDGIAPEISSSIHKILNYVNSRYNLELLLSTHSVGFSSLQKHNTTLHPSVVEAAAESDGIILSPLSTYQYPDEAKGGVNVSSYFRRKFNLYANVRPCITRKSSAHQKSKMNLIIFRENTEGFYAARSMHAGTGEFMPDSKTAYSLRKITYEATQLIAEIALNEANRRRKELIVIHKANVFKLSDGLFLETVYNTAKSFPDIKITELLVDSAAALLIRTPNIFDVILTTNMFGDILSNQAAELSGGLGLAPSINIGKNIAMAQAAHGSAPDIAGKNIANPTGLILSVAMLLDWYGNRKKLINFNFAAKSIEKAIDLSLSSPGLCTKDQGGIMSTTNFTLEVIKNLKS